MARWTSTAVRALEVFNCVISKTLIHEQDAVTTYLNATEVGD